MLVIQPRGIWREMFAKGTSVDASASPQFRSVLGDHRRVQVDMYCINQVALNLVTTWAAITRGGWRTVHVPLGRRTASRHKTDTAFHAQACKRSQLTGTFLYLSCSSRSGCACEGSHAVGRAVAAAQCRPRRCELQLGATRCVGRCVGTFDIMVVGLQALVTVPCPVLLLLPRRARLVRPSPVRRCCHHVLRRCRASTVGWRMMK